MTRKIAIILFAGIVIVSFVLIAGALSLYQNERAKSARLQAQVEELTIKQRATEAKLEDAKKTVTRLQLELQEVKGQIASLNKELDDEKSSRLDASSKLEQLKSDLEQQKALRQDLEEKFNQASDEGIKIKEQLKLIQQQKEALENKLKELESGSGGVELGKVVVNNDMAGQASSGKPQMSGGKAAAANAQSLEGKVMVVNKDYNFAVINLGSKDGVKTDDLFSVYRDGKVIGELKVEKVHESMSAAGFPEDLKNTISENDIVAQKAK